MDRRQIALKLVLEGLGLDISLSKFYERLIIQKSVYLAQAAGVNMGYEFNWYLRGPYSRAVSNDVFTIQNETRGGADDSIGWKLDKETGGMLKLLSGLILHSDTLENRARFLELLASIHFLYSNGHVSERIAKNLSEIQRLLKKFKKNYQKKEILSAISELRKYKLLPQ
jgi:uncharacterized protein YwgA